MKAFSTYLENLKKKYATGKATEHTFRSDLEVLLDGLTGSDVTVLNDPKNYQPVTNCFPLAYL